MMKRKSFIFHFQTNRNIQAATTERKRATALSRATQRVSVMTRVEILDKIHKIRKNNHNHIVAATLPAIFLPCIPSTW